MVKNMPAVWETGFDSWVGKIPWRKVWQPSPVLLSGESPWTEGPGGTVTKRGHKELDMTERLSTAWTAAQFVKYVNIMLNNILLSYNKYNFK